jgi:hypothetical protein
MLANVRTLALMMCIEQGNSDLDAFAGGMRVARQGGEPARTHPMMERHP